MAPPTTPGIALPYNDSDLSVALAHVGLTDASVWTPVVAQLRAERVTVVTPASVLRQLAGDVDHVARVTGGAAGGVLLVGHGYGGAVIGEAATQADNAVGLVFITGYALDIDESVLDVVRAFPTRISRPRSGPGRPGRARAGYHSLRDRLPGPVRGRSSRVDRSRAGRITAADKHGLPEREGERRHLAHHALLVPGRGR
jgi:pimeloyl-ACP methyl ester carboxylesterase